MYKTNIDLFYFRPKEERAKGTRRMTIQFMGVDVRTYNAEGEQVGSPYHKHHGWVPLYNGEAGQVHTNSDRTLYYPKGSSEPTVHIGLGGSHTVEDPSGNGWKQVVRHTER